MVRLQSCKPLMPRRHNTEGPSLDPQKEASQEDTLWQAIRRHLAFLGSPATSLADPAILGHPFQVSQNACSLTTLFLSKLQ